MTPAFWTITIKVERSGTGTGDSAPGHERGKVEASVQYEFGHAVLTGNHNTLIALAKLARPHPEDARFHQHPQAVRVQCKCP